MDLNVYLKIECGVVRLMILFYVFVPKFSHNLNLEFKGIFEPYRSLVQKRESYYRGSSIFFFLKK